MLAAILVPIIAVVVIIVVILLAGVGIYNGIVTMRNRIDNAWSQIDVQLRKRFDLIPNLVETVKGYAAHEKETLEKVIAARGAGMQRIRDGRQVCLPASTWTGRPPRLCFGLSLCDGFRFQQLWICAS